MLPLTFVATRAVALMAHRRRESDAVLSERLCAAWPWLVRFATRLIARQLDVPEIVVHGICLYVAAYVAEVERNAALVCPIRVFLDLRRNRSASQTRSSSLRRSPNAATRAA